MLESADSLPKNQPITYASPGAFRYSRRLRVIAFGSLVVSILSLPVTGYLLWASLQGMSEASLNIARKQPEASWHELEY